MAFCELKVWLEDIYPKIVRDLGIDPERDRISAMIMYKLGKDKLLPADVLKVIDGKSVAVIGGAVKYEDLVDLDCDLIITAGKSVLRVIDYLTPDIHVTDMEEGKDILMELERRGSILVLHAHGDNIERIREVVPNLRNFVGTTQVEPFDRIYNFLGFTDGDRAVLIAKRFGARSIKLVGFDFRRAEGIKLKKLKWAEYIIKSFIKI